MLDIKYIKDNPEEVIARLAKKGKDAKEDIEMILKLDADRRAIIGEVEQLKAEQNKTNKLFKIRICLWIKLLLPNSRLTALL